MKKLGRKRFDIICLSVIVITALLAILAFAYVLRIHALHDNGAYEWDIVDPDKYHGKEIVAFAFLPLIFKEVALFLSARYLWYTQMRDVARIWLNRLIFCASAVMLLTPIVGNVFFLDLDLLGWDLLRFGKSSIVFSGTVLLCIADWCLLFIRKLTHANVLYHPERNSLLMRRSAQGLLGLIAILLAAYISLFSVLDIALSKGIGNDGYTTVYPNTASTTWHTDDTVLSYTYSADGNGYGTLKADGKEISVRLWIGFGSDEPGCLYIYPANLSWNEHWETVSCYETPSQVVYVYKVKETTYFEVGQTFRLIYDKPMKE